jgi:hypothetical protein
MTYPKWVEKCYVERIRQILGDPVEFGKAVLERKKSPTIVFTMLLSYDRER